jgi:DNA-binding transcriptional LysR family regulator
MLEVRRLRILREVAVRGTIRAAAEALHLTGPAVSQQLAALEREAGVTLLEREGRSVRLTAAALTLVAHAETILAQLEAAEADLAAGEGRFGGELRLGAFPSFAVRLGPLVRDLAQAMPHVRIGVRELEPEAALDRLRVGELDVAVAHEYDHVPRRGDDSLHATSLFSEPLLLALPAGHPLAGGPVALADLAGHPGWIAPPEGLTCHQEVLRMCAAAGFAPRIASLAYGYDVTLALVAAGGVALVPELAVAAAPDGVVLREPSDVAGRRHVFAAVRRGSAHRPSIARALDGLVNLARRSRGPGPAAARAPRAAPSR